MRLELFLRVLIVFRVIKIDILCIMSLLEFRYMFGLNRELKDVTLGGK
jgi:hypothetical protein